MESDRRANRKSGGHAGGTWARQSEPEAGVQPERRAKAACVHGAGVRVAAQGLAAGRTHECARSAPPARRHGFARKYTRENGAITLFVVHDLMLASRYSSRLLMLHEGRIKAFDTAERVLHPHLLGDVYDVEASVERTRPGFLNVIPVRPL